MPDVIFFRLPVGYVFAAPGALLAARRGRSAHVRAGLGRRTGRHLAGFHVHCHCL